MKWIEINLDKFHTKSLKTYYLTDIYKYYYFIYLLKKNKKMNCVNCNTTIDKKAPLSKC